MNIQKIYIYIYIFIYIYIYNVEDVRYMFTEVDLGKGKQIYEVIGHPVEIYSDVLQTKEETMK